MKPPNKTTVGKAKSSRSRSGTKSIATEEDSSSPPELLDDSSSSEVSNLSVLFDSGSSEDIVPQQFLIQSSTLITEPRIEMESAFGEILSPTTVGTFKNLKPCYSLPLSSSDDALLSISRLVNTEKSVLIDQSGLHLYDNSPTVLHSLNKFKNFSAKDLILTAPEDNGVYSLLSHQIPEFLFPKLRRKLIKTIQSYHTKNFNL